MSFKKFAALALVGFVLGGGMAYIQNSKTPSTIPLAPEAAATDSADTGAATDGSVAGSSVGGPFMLTDFNDKVVTDKSYPGKLKLVFFGFTNCPDICPAALDKINGAFTKLGADADKIQMLFITTDPARDTAPVLKAYLGNMDKHYVGLTGTKEQLEAVYKAYKAYVSEEATPAADAADHAGHGAPATINHSGYIYLMSEDNKLLELMNSADTIDTIEAKIRPHVATAAPAAAETPAAETPAADAAQAADEPAPAANMPPADGPKPGDVEPLPEGATPPPAPGADQHAPGVVTVPSPEPVTEGKTEPAADAGAAKTGADEKPAATPDMPPAPTPAE